MRRLPVAVGHADGPLSPARPRTGPRRRTADGLRRLGTRIAALMLLSSLPGCGAEAPLRPNLILITIDRLAADRLACFGGPSDAGSSICALRDGGTLFAWTATAGAGEASGAATVLTGLGREQHAVRDDGRSFLADGHDTIAEALSRAGYATAAFVASARVNHIRRLDQGFDLYDDRLAGLDRREDAISVELSGRVQAWIAEHEAPWFVWIHADRAAGTLELDRLVSRLSRTLDGSAKGPGILFVALRGEALEGESSGTDGRTEASSIGWSSHRVPLIWRPPPSAGAADGATPVSRRLASLIDVATTLRAVAHTPSVATEDPPVVLEGLDLRQLALPIAGEPSADERFVLLETTGPPREVGLATQTHLYRRRSSPLDGSARPVPSESLADLAARFAVLPTLDPLNDPSPRDGWLSPGAWREDILSVKSPVPRLEFHLARRLARSAQEKTE